MLAVCADRLSQKMFVCVWIAVLPFMKGVLCVTPDTRVCVCTIASVPTDGVVCMWSFGLSVVHCSIKTDVPHLVHEGRQLKTTPKTCYACACIVLVVGNAA